MKGSLATGRGRGRRATSGGAKRSPQASDTDRRRVGYLSLKIKLSAQRVFAL